MYYVITKGGGRSENTKTWIIGMSKILTFWCPVLQLTLIGTWTCNPFSSKIWNFLDFWLVLTQKNLFTWNPKTFVTSLIDKSFGIPVIVFLLSRGQRKCELGEIYFEKNENPFMSRLKPKWRWLSLLCNIF